MLGGVISARYKSPPKPAVRQHTRKARAFFCLEITNAARRRPHYMGRGLCLALALTPLSKRNLPCSNAPPEFS